MRKTPQSIASLFLALFVAAVSTSPLFAAEKLPSQLPIKISARSANELLDAVDAFAVAVTKGSPQQMMPGLLPRMAMVFIPFADETWEMDKPLHILLNPTIGRIERNHLFVFHADFDNFSKSLVDEGFDLQSGTDGEPAQLRLGQFGSYFIESAGEDLVVAASNRGMLEQYRLAGAAGWVPEFSGEGVLTVDALAPDGWIDRLGVAEEVKKSLSSVRESLMDETTRETAALAEVDLDGKGLVPLIDGLDLLFDKAFAEIGMVENVTVDLAFDQHSLSVLAHIGSKPTALMSQFAAYAGKMKPVNTAIAANVPADSAVVFIGQAIPDFAKHFDYDFAGVAGEILDTVVPAQKDEYFRLQREMMRLANGTSAAAMIFEGLDANSSITWVESPDPEQLRKLYLQLFEQVNISLNSLFGSFHLGFSFHWSDAELPGGIKHTVVNIEPNNQEKFDLLVEQAATANASLRESFQQLFNLNIRLIPMDGVLVVSSGDMDEDYISSVVNGREEPFMRRQAVADAIARLRYKSYGYALLDFNEFFHLFAETFPAAMTETVRSMTGLDVGNAYYDALDQARGTFRTIDDVAGYGFGATGDRLVMEINCSTAAISAFRRNYQILSQAMQNAPLEEYIQMPPAWDDEEGWDGGADDEGEDMDPDEENIGEGWEEISPS